MIYQSLKLSVAISLTTAAVITAFASPSFASSHREAPFISSMPKVDATDFYLFKSYEADKAKYVTVIANYMPLQDAYGGPNYFMMDPAAVYEIKIDNNGDSVEDLTYQFRFNNTTKDAKFNGVSIPLVVSGAGISEINDTKANVRETFSIDLVKGESADNSKKLPITIAGSNNTVFDKPLDNIGTKTIPNYAEYAQKHIYAINIPGCDIPARVFVGQRKESFVVNLGETFDLLNLNPLGAETGEKSDLEDKNVTSIAMEIPTSCLTAGKETVIGGWTTAKMPRTRFLNEDPTNLSSSVNGKKMIQVSRLGMPLVNEVVIGLKDKDRFNKSKPRNDVRDFGSYIVKPTLPTLIEALFGVPAPSFDRTDLVTVFATGIKGLNQPANVKPGEMTRLNTAIPATPLANQDPLGVLNLTDLAGFPNGRRLVDDVVDIEIRVAEGLLCTAGVKSAAAAAGVDTGCGSNTAPNTSALPFTDGSRLANSDLSDTSFPYLKTPIGGSPNASTN